MQRYDRRVFILRVWLERDRADDEPRWRASLTDELDARAKRYFASPEALLEHLRQRLRGWTGRQA